jgi:hypothetical protein
LWKLKAEVETTFKSRHELTRQFVALQRDRVLVMHNLLVGRYEVGVEPGSRPLTLTQHPELGVWELQQHNAIAGSLTGMGELPLPLQVEREIHAALALDAQITPALELAEEVAWLYYQSRNNFIYIAPKISSAEFHLRPNFTTVVIGWRAASKPTPRAV